MIEKVADGDTTWGPEIRAVIGHINASNVVYSFEPPPGLTAIVADGTDMSARIQAHLDYVKNTHGGGQVVIIKPGATITCSSGLTIPTRVQLVSDERTILSFPTLSNTGSAITVNDSGFVPLVGVRVQGPSGDPRTTPSNTADVSTGISVTGVGLKFYNTFVRSFGRGVHLAHTGTYIVSFIGGAFDLCRTGVYCDTETEPITECGERFVFDSCAISNSILALHVTGNSVSMFINNTSVDFCTEFGRFLNSWTHFTGCHLETGGSGAGPNYLFDVTGNSHVAMANTLVLMSSSRTGGLYHLFRSDAGPTNFGFGGARFKNVAVFYTDQAGNQRTVQSEHMTSWAANITSLQFRTPFPYKWCPVSALFAATDTYPLPTHDTVRIASMSSGLLTLEASAGNAATRFVRIQFG